MSLAPLGHCRGVGRFFLKYAINSSWEGHRNESTIHCRQFSTPPKPPPIYSEMKCYYGYRNRKVLKPINLAEPVAVKKFVKQLNAEEKENLLNELQDNFQHAADETDVPVSCSKEELRALFIFNCLPFIGFGFLDNAVMICAGEYIDHTIGMWLGISTMAAAGLGNLISDLFGVGVAGYVEAWCSKLGYPAPDLTNEQTDLTSTRIVANLGKAIGIIVGCLIGMFPLLFMKNDKPDEDKS